MGVGTDGEGAGAFDLWRDGGEGVAAFRKLFQVTQVFDDEDLCSQQNGVHRPGAATRIVDVMAVDAHKSNVAVAKIDGGFFGEIGMVFKVFFGVPVFCPASVDEDRLVADLFSGEVLFADGGGVCGVDGDRRQIGERFQRDGREVFAVCVAVKMTRFSIFGCFDAKIGGCYQPMKTMPVPQRKRVRPPRAWT